MFVFIYVIKPNTFNLGQNVQSNDQHQVHSSETNPNEEMDVILVRNMLFSTFIAHFRYI